MRHGSSTSGSFRSDRSCVYLTVQTRWWQNEEAPASSVENSSFEWTSAGTNSTWQQRVFGESFSVGQFLYAKRITPESSRRMFRVPHWFLLILFCVIPLLPMT